MEPKLSGPWVQSSFCNNSACAQIAPLADGGVAMRNSSDPGNVIKLTREEFIAFRSGVLNGEFDVA